VMARAPRAWPARAMSLLEAESGVGGGGPRGSLQCWLAAFGVPGGKAALCISKAGRGALVFLPSELFAGVMTGDGSAVTHSSRVFVARGHLTLRLHISTDGAQKSRNACAPLNGPAPPAMPSADALLPCPVALTDLAGIAAISPGRHSGHAGCVPRRTGTAIGWHGTADLLRWRVYLACVSCA
jgi:hypothetical protein